jgi:hypothetical protein
MFTGVDSAINYYYYYYYYYYVVLLYLISMHLKKLISLLLKVHKYSRRDETERSAIYTSGMRDWNFLAWKSAGT